MKESAGSSGPLVTPVMQNIGLGIESPCPSAWGPEPHLLDVLSWMTIKMSWKVFPCWGTDGRSCHCPEGSECTSPGKHPWTPGAPNGHLSATSDLHEVLQIHLRYPEANWAISLAASGLLVIDVDNRFGGHESIKNVSLPATFQVQTGDGCHHYFKVPKTMKTRKRLVGPDGSTLKGVDIKHSGYVMIPGCAHWSGKKYSMINTSNPQEMPKPLQDLCVAPGDTISYTDRQGTKNTKFSSPGLSGDLTAIPDRTSRRVLGFQCKKVKVSRSGTRNNTLFQASCEMGRLVSSSRIQESVVVSYLLRAASHAGLRSSESRKTIASGLLQTRNKPRNKRSSSRDIDRAVLSALHLDSMSASNICIVTGLARTTVFDSLYRLKKAKKIKRIKKASLRGRPGYVWSPSKIKKIRRNARVNTIGSCSGKVSGEKDSPRKETSGRHGGAGSQREVLRGLQDPVPDGLQPGEVCGSGETLLCAGSVNPARDRHLSRPGVDEGLLQAHSGVSGTGDP